MASDEEYYSNDSMKKQIHSQQHEVNTCTDEPESRMKKSELLEIQYGDALTALQDEYPLIESLNRTRLLKLMKHFNGNIDAMRQYFEKLQSKENYDEHNTNRSRRQQQEELKAKYSTQLVTAGININCPRVLAQLEKHNGDVDKVIEIVKRRTEEKDEQIQLNKKYATQLAQLESDGFNVKKNRLIIQLLEQTNGQVDVVKELLLEKQEQKNKIQTSEKIRYEMDVDDIDHLKQLRSAGIHGNPIKILTIFHQCNQSIELTRARIEQKRQQREYQSEKRTEQRISLADIHNSYLTLNNRNDWPNNIEQVYLDGNNMMFVIDSLRRLCLNNLGKKTERAIAEIAAAWNEQMHIKNVELIFDSTHQLDQIGTIKVSSAQPLYKTTDDMIIDISQRTENKEKNRHTIVVTSDRSLAIQLKSQGCQLVKSYQWFAHCVMVLTPDLIKEEETTNKTRYNLDEFVDRIAKIDI